MAFATTKKQIDEYVKGKTWYWYVPVWIAGIYMFIRLLGFNPNAQLAFPINIAQAFDFFLHEMAHIVTAFLPQILVAAAGSFSELLLGSLLVFGAFKGRTYFTVMITSLWFMLTCQSVGVYMADARAQNLELVSLGGAIAGSDKATHDWNFVFGKLHMLGWDTFIGNSVRAIGIAVGLFGLAFAAWLMYKMAAAKDEKPESTEDEKNLLLTSAASMGLDDVPEVKPDTPTKTGGKSNLYPTATKGPLAERPKPKPPQRP